MMRNAIDLQCFQKNDEIRQMIRKKYGFGDGLCIGHIGRFSLPKNHFFVLEISTVLIFLPIIYIALTGSWKYYVTYAVSSARGLTESNKMALMTPCMLISMIVYFGTVLKNNLTMKKIILF